MKILHISSPKTWRGGEQQLMYLAEELKSRNVDQIIMCPFNSAIHRYCLKHHFKHVTYFKGFSANPMVAFRVYHLCKREQISLIHVHDSHAHNFAILAAVLTNNLVPIVVSRRVDFPVSETAVSSYKYNHPQIKKIICVSNAIREVMAPSITDKERLTVVHSGIDLSKFEGLGKNDVLRSEFDINADVKLIGSVAALAPHKDYETFIKTARKVVDSGKNVHFFAIGEGPSRRDVEQWICKYDMTEHMTLTGFRENVLELLSSLDVFLITSETEGLGTSILDSLACGVPVVATRAGGIIEIIEDEKNGLLADVKDHDHLASQVIRMIEEDGLSERLVETGHETVKKFTRQEMASKTLEIYSEILSSDSSDREDLE